MMVEQDRLTEREHWDRIYGGAVAAPEPGEADRSAKPSRRQRVLRRWFPGIAGQCFAEYVMWDVYAERYLPRGDSRSLIEIGSAPGRNLIRCRRALGIEPYGVEYSPAGVSVNRRVFEENGVPGKNVIEADFFSHEFQDQYAGYFDAVMSHGFIEHFTDTRSALDGHLKLLKPGGVLFVTVPNFRGINKYLMRWFDGRAEAIHNLSMMNTRSLGGAIDSDRADIVECRPMGTFHLGVFTVKGAFRLKVFSLLYQFQRLLEPFFYLFLRKGGLDTRFTSPYLLLVAKKRSVPGGGR